MVDQTVETTLAEKLKAHLAPFEHQPPPQPQNITIGDILAEAVNFQLESQQTEKALQMLENPESIITSQQLQERIQNMFVGDQLEQTGLNRLTRSPEFHNKFENVKKSALALYELGQKGEIHRVSDRDLIGVLENYRSHLVEFLINHPGVREYARVVHNLTDPTAYENYCRQLAERAIKNRLFLQKIQQIVLYQINEAEGTLNAEKYNELLSAYNEVRARQDEVDRLEEEVNDLESRLKERQELFYALSDPQAKHQTLTKIKRLEGKIAKLKTQMEIAKQYHDAYREDPQKTTFPDVFDTNNQARQIHINDLIRLVSSKQNELRQKEVQLERLKQLTNRETLAEDIEALKKELAEKKKLLENAKSAFEEAKTTRDKLISEINGTAQNLQEALDRAFKTAFTEVAIEAKSAVEEQGRERLNKLAGTVPDLAKKYIEKQIIKKNGKINKRALNSLLSLFKSDEYLERGIEYFGEQILTYLEDQARTDGNGELAAVIERLKQNPEKAREIGIEAAEHLFKIAALKDPKRLRKLIDKNRALQLALRDDVLPGLLISALTDETLKNNIKDILEIKEEASLRKAVLEKVKKIPIGKLIKLFFFLVAALTIGNWIAPKLTPYLQNILP